MFQRAPWFIKILLVVLPLSATLRLIAVIRAVPVIISLPSQNPSFWLAVALDICHVLLLATAAFSVWRQRPGSRWIAALALVSLWVYGIHRALSGDQAPPLLPRVEVDESRPGYEVGTFLAQSTALWWTYLCVFSERSATFFSSSSRTK